jgi:hypothetical protein
MKERALKIDKYNLIFTKKSLTAFIVWVDLYSFSGFQFTFQMRFDGMIGIFIDEDFVPEEFDCEAIVEFLNRQI